MIPTATAHDGFAVPVIGFGTYLLRGDSGARSIATALEAGYRLLDSAVNYDNEGTLGRAVRAAALPRDEVIVTTKLPGRYHAYEQALLTVQESLFRTGLDRIDLYLIHWPTPRVDRYVEAWRALVEARRRGLVREIGVCNFLPEHLERLERETGVLPAVNQIELHPYFPQTEALAYHRRHGILTEAWTPIGRGNDLLTDPVVAAIASGHGATPAQAVLAWHRAVGTIPLPKAADPGRQRENLESISLELTAAEVDALTALGRPDGRTTNQDPAVWEEF